MTDPNLVKVNMQTDDNLDKVGFREKNESCLHKKAPENSEALTKSNMKILLYNHSFYFAFRSFY